MTLKKILLIIITSSLLLATIPPLNAIYTYTYNGQQLTMPYSITTGTIAGCTIFGGFSALLFYQAYHIHTNNPFHWDEQKRNRSAIGLGCGGIVFAALAALVGYGGYVIASQNS